MNSQYDFQKKHKTSYTGVDLMLEFFLLDIL
jgi:hypothetical protein